MRPVDAVLLVLALAVSPAWAQPLQGSAPDPGGCIAQFLGRGYYVTAPGRQCTQDGFPYTIVPLN